MNTANVFRGYMAAAWFGASDDNDNDYESDAVIVADALGGRRRIMSNPSPVPDTCIHECVFPDGSVTYIIVGHDGVGSGCDDSIP